MYLAEVEFVSETKIMFAIGSTTTSNMVVFSFDDNASQYEDIGFSVQWVLVAVQVDCNDTALVNKFVKEGKWDLCDIRKVLLDEVEEKRGYSEDRIDALRFEQLKPTEMK